ncbi:epidermal growth factor receptor substrate 15-like 1 isoform X2 [Rhagoletis pomonella]|uniref:epidermal growth factor receptor substrate 15-like 1 isoform X2 n=1 Tax=Rhagoletis pomonella TaxID=28610 RepID=UPI00177CEA00|nr:epidermal growth factor receptor substrate 15-like 1 isoform X2 [Rhagoletis pomonella]
MNLDFAKLCGKHGAIYEAYYKQIDPKGSGAIEAMTAAKFLKKSGLSDVVLSRIWDLSDPNGKGFLDKPGFFVALKLVSLAQAGQVINMSNIYNETPNPPKVGDIPKIMPPRIQTVPVSSGGITSGDWSISIIDRLKYEQLFETLKPVNGMLAGNKVKGVLMDSKLPMDTLGKIWDLADQDKDGNLDKHEFIVAMHLVYQTLEKRTVPDVLPPELRKAGAGGGPPPKPAPPAVTSNNAAMPRAPSGEGFGDGGFVANFPKDIAPPPAIPPLPAIPTMTRVPPVGASVVQTQPLISTDPLIPIGAPPSVTASADWVVSPAELNRFEITFRESDRDKDGLVSGLEVKNVFLQSGVQQHCLAHIWALCDTNQSGKLTLEQFALAMWMVERKQKGIEPPQVLTANMVPPSMRSTVSGVDLQPQEPKPTYSNPELEMISKEIEELAKERRALETEIAQKEADIRIKSGEVRSLQSELDTLSATLKQLENQRGEAQKRLDDLQAQVNKIREQCQKQEETINEQEGELNAKRSELQKLKDEEAALQKEYDQNNRELQKLTQHLQNTQLQISSVRSMVTQLMETQRQMTDALLMCRAAISNQDAELVSEYQLKIEPDFSEARQTLEKKIEEPKADDPFDENTTTSQATKTLTTNGFTSNGFSNDPFAANSINTSTGRSGFDDSFTTASGFGDSGFDAFGNSSAFNQPQKDPFGADAFSANKASNAVTPEPGKDDFGSDPFAALHAPTGQGQVLSPNTQKSGPPPRPESPSPALPPKKSKVPPPRPAPPRPMQGPARPTQPSTDAFGSNTSGGGGGFADFADFDNKVSSIPPPTVFPPQIPSAFVSLNSTNNSSSSSSFDISTPTPSANVKSTTSVTSTLASTSASISSSSPSTSVSTLTTIANISNNSSTTSSSVNDHLTRSITPLQQASAVTSLFGNKSATVGAGNKSATVGAGVSARGSRASIISGPTDFSDDPFKDYRYEDPFSIKDPFADDEDIDTDPEKVFKDDLSDDDKTKTTSTVLVTGTINSQVMGASNKSTTPLSAEFLDRFDAFNLNSSPAPSQHSSTSGGLTGLGVSVGAQSSISSSSKNSKSATPPLETAGFARAESSSLFYDFANFDAFGAQKPQTTGTMSALGELEAAFKSNTTLESKPNANDSFFDAFNDNFDKNSNPVAKTKSNTSKANANIFDAFGDSKTNFDPFDAFGSSKGGDASTLPSKGNSAVTKSSKVFDDFNDNTFEDEFFKTKDNNANASNFDTDVTTKDDSFAKFDAFGDSHNFTNDFATALNNSINLINNEDSKPLSATSKDLSGATSLLKVQNVTTLSKVTNPDVAAAVSGAVGENGGKVAEKFISDYSKADTFEMDLQEALKRSMLDK